MDGFSLRGADNSGQCYYVGKSVKKTKDADQVLPADDVAPAILISDTDKLNLFQDSKLTLDDSTIYGCHLDFTFAQLKNFCTSRHFEHLMIFNNLYQFNSIGRFGNSDPHNVKDWIDVTELDFSANPSVELEESTCKFPAAAFIRIFYQKIGKATNP